MSNDLLLKELAQVIRDREAEERSRFDERWDRLSAGTLSQEEEAELRALAETSEEARAAYEAFRPLGADFQARVVQKIQEQRPAPAAEPEVTKLPPKPLPFRPFTPQILRWAGWSTAAAAAAVAALMMIPPPQMPDYTSAPIRGDQEFRGETQEPSTGTPVFSPGSTLTFNAYPEQAVTGTVKAQAYAAHGSELILLEREPEVVKGTVRLRGTLGEEIQLPPGDWRIWIVVGRPGKIPAKRDLQAELRAGRTRHAYWQAVSVDLRVEERQASP